MNTICPKCGSQAPWGAACLSCGYSTAHLYRLACQMPTETYRTVDKEAEKAIWILKTTVAIHRDTSYLWRQRAELAEAKVKVLEAENVQLRERWAAKAHELHTLKQEIAGQEPEPRRVADVAIGRIIQR